MYEQNLKPTFATQSYSIKQILKVLFLPISPKGRGFAMYLLYPILVIWKITVLIGIPVCIVMSFSEPGLFFVALFFFCLFCPGIFGIIAFKGKVVESSLSTADLKKSVTVKMKKMGATDLNSTRGNILEFRLHNINKDEPPELLVEVVKSKNTRTSYARILMSNYYEGLYVKSDDQFSFIIALLFKIFVTRDARKVNKIIKQLDEELQNDTYRASTPSPSKDTARETSNSSAQEGVLLDDDQIMKLLIKYEQGPESVKDKSMQIILSFPETKGKASEIDRIEKLTKANEQETVPACIDQFIKLLKNDDKFSMTHERTDAEYYQTYTGGIIMASLISSKDDREIAATLCEDNIGLVLIVTFLELAESEFSKDETFIDIGREMLNRFEKFGISDGILEVYEYHDGEQINLL